MTIQFCVYLLLTVCDRIHKISKEKIINFDKAHIKCKLIERIIKDYVSIKNIIDTENLSKGRTPKKKLFVRKEGSYSKSLHSKTIETFFKNEIEIFKPDEFFYELFQDTYDVFLYKIKQENSDFFVHTDDLNLQIKIQSFYEYYYIFMSKQNELLQLFHRYTKD